MKTLFPYPVLFGDITLHVTDVEIDGEAIHGRVHEDGSDVDLSGIERKDWGMARLEVALSGPQSEIAEQADVGAVVVLNCGFSNSRICSQLEPDGAVPGRWRGALELDRDSWFGRASLRGMITATVDSVPNRIIGSASDWTIGFDDLPRSPVNGAITVRWVDFGYPDDDAQYLKRYATDPWYLRIDPYDPVLFLNKGFEGLEALMNDRRRRPDPERALHDQVRSSLAAEVWLGLFNAALDATEMDDEEMLVWPSEEWQRSVLASLLNRMYQDKGRDDALHEAFTARMSPDSAAALQERLLPAATTQVKLPRLLRQGIRLLSSDPPMTDEEQA